MRPSRGALRSGALVSGVLVALLVAGTAGGAVAEKGDVARHRTAFSYTDRDITESSGLVARGDVMFTVNDSGDGPLLYAVDAHGGDTVGVTTYSGDDVRDVEALAPGADGDVWVGDIGDNNEDRSSVDVYRVPVPRPRGDRGVDAQRYTLVYPDAPHDAETLLVHPSTQRVYLVSKGILGGTVYAAPASPTPGGAVNPMTELGRVPGLVTDGAFFPDGRHILLRSYGGAAVYTFPGLRAVGRFDLPAQEQGEALAIDRSGRVFIGTEGAYTEVWQILLPEPVRAELGADLPSALPSPTTSPDAADPGSDRLSTEEGDGIWVAGGILLVTLAGWLFFTVSRRRSPRRR